MWFTRGCGYTVFSCSLSGGELLAHLAEKETLTEEECSHYLRQVLEGLHYIHSNNIIHMAVKVGVSFAVFMECYQDFVPTARKCGTDFQPPRYQAG